MIYLLLFYEFFKIGLFTIGGGMAALPFLYDLAGRYDWFTAAEVTDMIAISQSTPGPIGINMATFVGYTTAGVAGSLLATAAVILPECIIVLAVARVLGRFKQNRLVEAGFYGIRPAVAALITVALVTVMQVTLVNWPAFWPGLHFAAVDWRAVLLFAVALFAMLRWKKNPILYIVAGAVLGLLFAPG